MRELIIGRLYWHGYLTKKIFIPTTVFLSRHPRKIGWFVASGLLLDIESGEIVPIRNIFIYDVKEVTEQERGRLLRNARRRGFSEEALNILRKKRKRVDS